MHFDLSSHFLRTATVLVVSALLAGCGNGRGQQSVPGTPQPELTGQLVDSPVSGVAWKTSGGKSGLTNDLGEFQYVQPEAGTYTETITFSIGDIVLGTVEGIPFKGDRLYVTAVELTGSIDPLDRAATNQLVFIQSIDEDEDPTNGITISEATQAAAVGQTLDFNSSNFATEVVEVVAAIAPGNTVVTDTQALDHFYTTYAALGGTDTFDWLFPGYPPVGEGEGVFQLVFADEFNTDGPPNPDVWNFDLGYGPNGFGWGNNEWQLYTDSPENIRVEDGNLVITALCPVKPCGVRDGTITSARITTNDKYEFKYGKVVARIKPPVGKGTWPAFWALGKDFPDVQWPRVGEIDFMEVFNNTNNDAAQSAVAERTATSAMHWCDETIVPNPNVNCFVEGGRVFVTDKLELEESLNNDFQIWEADWNADRVIVSINGIQYFELDIDPTTMEEFRREFFLLLNVAMGGTLGSGGTPPTGDETFPQTMLVDYVRVYQQVGDITPPELTAVNIASDNADGSLAKLGDTVTITLTANEAIVAPVVIIGGTAATTVTGSGTDWQASRVIAAGDDTDGSPIAFTIDYDDLAGNAGVQVSGTTDGSVVIVDAIVPELDEVKIASDNANPAFATTDDVVTVTLTASEPIVEPVVTIGGSAATTVTGSGRNWQASREMAAGDDTGAETIAFTIDYADFAGNAGVPVTDTTDASSITVDTVAPTVQILGVPVEPFGNLDPFAVTFQFSEPVTGFDVSGIVVTDADGVPNGVARDLVVDSEDPSLFTATVTPTGFGDVLISVEAGAASDAAGNESEIPEEVPEVVNGLNPDAPLLSAVSIRSTTNPDPNYAKEGDTVQIAFTATEDITRPTVMIASREAAVTGGPLEWTASAALAPPDDSEGPIAFNISGFTAIDDGAAGYATSVPVPDVSQTVIFDSIRPTLAIEGLPVEIQSLDPIPVTFRFSEDVIGFDATDIGVTNGDVSNFAGSGAIYSADVTPNGGVTDGDRNLTVAIAEGAATDLAGNDNEAAEETSEVNAFWGLVWFDDFEVTDPSELVNWTVRTSDPGDCPDPCDGQQEYQTGRVTVVDGVLTIEADDTSGFGEYVSGIIDTRDNRALRYGRVEIDAVMPGNTGTLPSLRLLPVPTLPVGSPEYGAYGPWPQSGEIDIVNAPNLDQDNELKHTLRYGLPVPEDTATTATFDAADDPTVNTIQYAIEWADGEIRWFVNNEHVATQTKDTSAAERDNWYAYFEDADGVYTLGAGTEPFDQDFYIVIGLGVGDDPDSFFPQTLEIDEVRVYECVNPVVPSDINACLTGNDGLAPVPAPNEPYSEAIEVYTDAPATLDFEQPDGETTSGTWNQTDQPGDPSNSAVSDIAASDGANTVWNANIQAVVGAAFVTIDVGGFNEDNPAASLRYLDLSGGETAGEVLFRMRVNSASSGVELFFDLGDRPLNFGRVPLDFEADGQWRNYSIKIADLLAASVAQGRAFDIADVYGLSVGAISGSVNLDLDDISIKVACRDVGGCEATPRAELSVPDTPFEVYFQDFEDVNAADGGALGPFGLDFRVFAAVWSFGVDVGAEVGPVYTYGPFAAPNGGPGFSAIAGGEGGEAQGTQYLNIYSDYDNGDHEGGSADCPEPCTIETAVFREATIPAVCTNNFLRLTGQFKSKADCGIAEDPSCGKDFPNTSEASVFFKTIDPNDGFAATNDIRFVTTDADPDVWQEFEVTIDLRNPLLEGQLLQFGFGTEATLFNDSGVFYDNLKLSTDIDNACQDIF